MADEPGQFEVPDGGLGAIRQNHEGVDYRVLKAPYGRPNTTEGIYTIPSHGWVRISETLTIRHEMGRNAQVQVDGTTITFLTAGEWQWKTFVPQGMAMLKEFHVPRP
jgi:hypothetical protein